VNRPRFSETSLVESDLPGRALLLFIVHGLELGRGDVPDRIEEPSVVEPVDPFEGGEFYFLEALPRAIGPDHFCLKEPKDRLGQGVVVRIANTSHRRFDAGFGNSLRVADRDARPGLS
jgi:hypothetical protein